MAAGVNGVLGWNANVLANKFRVKREHAIAAIQFRLMAAPNAKDQTSRKPLIVLHVQVKLLHKQLSFQIILPPCRTHKQERLTTSKVWSREVIKWRPIIAI